jgi:hypothetical protein
MFVVTPPAEFTTCGVEKFKIVVTASSADFGKDVALSCKYFCNCPKKIALMELSGKMIRE